MLCLLQCEQLDCVCALCIPVVKPYTFLSAALMVVLAAVQAATKSQECALSLCMHDLQICKCMLKEWASSGNDLPAQAGMSACSMRGPV